MSAFARKKQRINFLSRFNSSPDVTGKHETVPTPVYVVFYYLFKSGFTGILATEYRADTLIASTVRY